jgi:hypothetical protein
MSGFHKRWQISCPTERLPASKGLFFFVIRFEVRTALIMKSSIFWDVTPCSLVVIYLSFGEMCLLGLLFNHEKGGSTFLRNVGKLVHYITPSHILQVMNLSKCMATQWCQRPVLLDKGGWSVKITMWLRLIPKAEFIFPEQYCTVIMRFL